MTSRQWFSQTIIAGEVVVIRSLALADVAGAIALRTGHSGAGRQSVR